ncbi:MAG: proton-conducting transporter membrane subunit [Myxococcota bacterium]
MLSQSTPSRRSRHPLPRRLGLPRALPLAHAFRDGALATGRAARAPALLARRARSGGGDARPADVAGRARAGLAAAGRADRDRLAQALLERIEPQGVLRARPCELVLAQGLAFVFGATGRLELDALSQAPGQPLLLDVGVALLIAGLLARAVVAPFHPWSPDVHEGAPSFVTTWIATGVQATSFFVLLRLLHALVPAADGDGAVRVVARLPELLGVLGVVGLVWGHAMALVQIGLRRMVGWLGVGQAGFFRFALVEARGAGGRRSSSPSRPRGSAVAGVLPGRSRLSAIRTRLRERRRPGRHGAASPIRAVFFALFLLSLAGFPGTMGFVARLRILSRSIRGDIAGCCWRGSRRRCSR